MTLLMLSNQPSPVSLNERTHELDVIRGFALFGILIANMPFFATPVSYVIMTDITLFTSTADRIAEWLIVFLASGKFFTMFSFLFGFGFVLFLTKAASRTDRPRTLFLRRLAFLLLIGLIHGYGIWYGDILVSYALTGVLLLAFYARKAKTILVWAILLLTVPATLFGLLGLLLLVMGDVIPDTGSNVAMMTGLVKDSFQAYGEGTFTDIAAMRIYDYNLMLGSYVMIMPMILGMFLLGMYAAKQDLHKQLTEKLPHIKKIWWITLVLGLPFNVLLTHAYFHQGGADVDGFMLLYYTGTSIGGPLLAIFYITSIVLLMQRPAWNRRLQLLAPTGRMALTNYLTHSVVMTVIFYNYGLGLYGEIGPAVWWLMAFVLFSIQIFFSRWWMSRFRFGPAEWLWRTLTYGKKQPFKQKPSA